MTDESSNNFADRLMDAMDEKYSACVVGLDPRIDLIPEHIRERALSCYGRGLCAVHHALVEFNTSIIDAVQEFVPAVKPQMAFYERFGSAGVEAFERTAEHARRRGLLVIEDAKRNDIGSTAEAYADGHLGIVQVLPLEESVPVFDVDALTVNAYLGSDGVLPFVKECGERGKGVFVLVKTSNKSSGELQDLLLKHAENVDLQAPDAFDESVAAQMARNVATWGEQVVGRRGYSSVGAVVGATYPEQAHVLRRLMPRAIILAPGYGAQGGTAKDVAMCFNDDGYGAIVNSSRDVIFAYLRGAESAKYGPQRFASAAKDVAWRMRDDVNRGLTAAGKLPQKWKYTPRLQEL